MNTYYQNAIAMARSELDYFNSEIYRLKKEEILENIYNGVEDLDYPAKFFDEDGEIVDMDNYSAFQEKHADEEASRLSNNEIDSITDLDKMVNYHTALNIIKKTAEDLGFDCEVDEPRCENTSYYLYVGKNDEEGFLDTDKCIKARFSDHSPKYDYDWSWIEGDISNPHCISLQKMIDKLITKGEDDA